MSGRTRAIPFHLRLRRCALHALLSALVLGLSATPGQGADQGAVQLAFLYNFTKFVTWPEAAMKAASDFELCILGDDPFGPTLDELSSKTVRDKPVRIARPRSAAALLKCQLVYIAPSESWRLKQILQEIGRAPILSISSLDDFADQGGVIRQFWENGKPRFEINLKAAQQSGLILSSKLLELAARIIKE